ncbi:hypothetical protein [Salegentibacter holothuriorum]|uniref:hypothetical protein n=1 Tax=Salegentibacter holothuriorum TaxID=241145 RepID=UPI0015913081|nr:hypothetical protein [Salegentibacter holothuriorum]
MGGIGGFRFRFGFVPHCSYLLCVDQLRVLGGVLLYGCGGCFPVVSLGHGEWFFDICFSAVGGFLFGFCGGWCFFFQYVQGFSGELSMGFWGELSFFFVDDFGLFLLGSSGVSVPLSGGGYTCRLVCCAPDRSGFSFIAESFYLLFWGEFII